MKDILIADYCVVSWHTRPVLYSEGRGQEAWPGRGGEGRAQSQARRVSSGLARCAVSVSRDQCGLHRITGNRGSLSMPLPFLVVYNISLSLTEQFSCFGLLQLNWSNQQIEFGWVQSHCVSQLFNEFSSFLSYIINALIRQYAFISCLLFFLRFWPKCSSWITPEIETLNPGKGLVHFTLSSDHSFCHRTPHLSPLIRPLIDQGISALDFDWLFLCYYKYLKQWLYATDGCPPLFWWQSDHWFAIVLKFYNSQDNISLIRESQHNIANMWFDKTNKTATPLSNPCLGFVITDLC